MYCANMLAIRCPHILCKLAIHSAITSSQTPTSHVIIFGSVMTSFQTKSPTPAFSHKVALREFVKSNDELIIRGHVQLTLHLIWLGGGGCRTIARVEGACAVVGGGSVTLTIDVRTRTHAHRPRTRRQAARCNLIRYTRQSIYFVKWSKTYRFPPQSVPLIM